MNRLSRDESGFSMVELVVVTFVTVLLMAGLSNMFVSGLRASTTASTRLSGQSNLNVALSRIEYEARCASSAALVSSGAGVTLTIPSNCPHANGTFTWCVTSGSLIRYTSSSCSGATSQTIATNVTSATPFSCLTTTGTYPRLQVAFVINSSSTSGNKASATEQIAMRNAAASTASVPGCS
jgi:Tfp pilus assembly protein PilW